MATTNFALTSTAGYSRVVAAEAAPAKPRAGGVQSVARATRLLMMVVEGEIPPTVTELAAAAGLPVPTAHHLLGALVDSGLLARDARKRYVLGPRVALLAEAYHRDLAAPGYLLDPLRQLTSATGETGYLIALRNQEIHILATMEGHHPVRVSVPSGSYSDAHARAGGKLMLTYMSEEGRRRYLRENPLRPMTSRTITDLDVLEEELRLIRERGYSREDEEFHSGVSCLSAPLLDRGVLVAGFSVSVPTQRFHEREQELTRALLDVTASTQRRLLRQGEPDGE
jgi:IclR family acetate operon transcriptional repressor